jgi:hypothetical protein
MTVCFFYCVTLFHRVEAKVWPQIRETLQKFMIDPASDQQIVDPFHRWPYLQISHSIPSIDGDNVDQVRDYPQYVCEATWNVYDCVKNGFHLEMRSLLVDVVKQYCERICKFLLTHIKQPMFFLCLGRALKCWRSFMQVTMDICFHLVRILFTVVPYVAIFHLLFVDMPVYFIAQTYLTLFSLLILYAYIGVQTWRYT